MLSENIDYMLMMQNIMILENSNPCEAFVMVMTNNEHDENKNWAISTILQQEIRRITLISLIAVFFYLFIIFYNFF